MNRGKRRRMGKREGCRPVPPPPLRWIQRRPQARAAGPRVLQFRRRRQQRMSRGGGIKPALAVLQVPHVVCLPGHAYGSSAVFFDRDFINNNSILFNKCTYICARAHMHARSPGMRICIVLTTSALSVERLN